MKARYINVALKDEIKSEIATHVRSKMEKSIPGKELKSLCKKLIARIRTIVKNQCPSSDIEVLKKYKLTTSHTSLYIGLSNDDKVYAPWYSNKKSSFKIEIDKKIETQLTNNGNNHLINLIKEDAKATELAISAYKINDHVSCEIKETVGAYMSRVNKFRTIKTLLNAYPKMKGFIPKETPPAGPPEPAREDKVIEAFEAA